VRKSQTPPRRWPVRVALLAVVAACLAARAPAGEGILGVRPGYGPATPSDVPNPQAIGRRIWVPGLDAGYDPQGLTIAGGQLLVSGYESRSVRKTRGPCRVYRIDPASGRQTGHFDVPAPCGHAGGIAYAGGGLLYVADTHTLFETTLDQAFGAAGPRFRVLPLGPGLRGGLAASGRGEVWLGTYVERGSGRISKFTAARLHRLPDGAQLTAQMASAQVPIPSYAQGAAVDGAGRIWVSRSDINWGDLERVDPASGRVLGGYKAPGGIEGIAFGRDGALWAVSEAGARHFYDRPFFSLFVPFYPLVFAIEPQRLR
jgi:sugar lactone lactonase YvrE